MLNFLLVNIVIFFIFWLVCNQITKNLLNQGEEDLAIAAMRYRKTIMYSIFISIILFFFNFNFNFFTWIGIIYYIIISILEAILLIISFITGIDEDIKNKYINVELWKVTFTKLLNEITSIIMIFFLFSLLN